MTQKSITDQVYGIKNNVHLYNTFLIQIFTGHLHPEINVPKIYSAAIMM